MPHPKEKLVCWLGLFAGLVATLLVSPAFPQSAFESDPAPRPHILLVVVDDLGARDLGCFGSPVYQTPHLDRLATQSVRFRSFYAAHPVCSPTRAALMTGKFPHRLGITDWIPQPSPIHLPHRETTLAEQLADRGYRTGYVGKWHLGDRENQGPANHGFQWTRGVNRAGQPGSYFFPYEGRRQNGIAYWDVPDFQTGQPGDYLTDRLTDAAIEFFSEADETRPHFLCLAYYAVHTPIQAPADLVKKYENAPGVETPTEADEFREEKFGARTRIRQDHATYAAMVERLDWNLGRLLSTLRDRGLDEQTIVVITSDNGGLSTLAGERVGPTSNLPWRAGKGWVYEGGIRIPTLMCWPGQWPPADIDTPAVTTDLSPTLQQLAGIPPDQISCPDGESLVPILRGESPSRFRERPLVWHYPHRHGSGHRPASALRIGPWKLILWQETDDVELYHLDDDPQEGVNLASVEPARAAAMKEQLTQLLAEQKQKFELE